MKTPHKYAELIKAWADGAEIEIYSDSRNEWVGYAGHDQPSWSLEYKYRIKPEPKPDMITSVKVIGKGNSIVWNSERHTVIDANLKLTFDSQTGKLKSAEVL